MTARQISRLLIAGLIACLMALGAACSGDDGREGSAGEQAEGEPGALAEETRAEREGDRAARQKAREQGKRGDDRGGASPGTREAEGRSADERSPEAREAIRQRREANRGARPTASERQAEETVSGFYEILGQEAGSGDEDSVTLDLEAFCDLMSAEAIEQTIEYARISSGLDREWNCESAVELLVTRSKKAGGLGRLGAVEVVGVNAEGDRATATVSFGRRGALRSIPLVREDGEWKLASTVPGGG